MSQDNLPENVTLVEVHTCSILKKGTNKKTYKIFGGATCKFPKSP